MNLPAFTKNQKIFLASFAGVLTVAFFVLASFIWIKTKELATFEQIPTLQKDFLLPTSSAPEPKFLRYTDSDYGFSFSYPSNINLQKSSKNAEQLVIDSPTYHPTVKKYTLLQDSQTQDVEIFVIEGNFSQKLNQLDTIIQSSAAKPTQTRIETADGKTLLLLEFPGPNGSFLAYGYYQVSPDHYLQIAIPPEFNSTDNHRLIIRQMLQTLSSKNKHVET